MKSKKRLLPLGFIAVMAGLLIASVAGDPAGAWSVARQGWDHPTILAEALEDFLCQNLPFREELRGTALRLRMLGGAVQQDGIFLVEDGLVPDLVVTSDTTIHRANTRQILAAIKDASSPAYLMLIPTACAIYQDKLPSYVPLYQQRSYIESTYKQFYGSAVTVDAYNALLYSDSSYLYYRTEDNLAPLGGYALYQALAPRLGFTAKPLQQFAVSYDVHDYYGDLYARWGYGGVRPDVIATYRDVTGATPAGCSTGSGSPSAATAPSTPGRPPPPAGAPISCWGATPPGWRSRPRGRAAVRCWCWGTAPPSPTSPSWRGIISISPSWTSPSSPPARSPPLTPTITARCCSPTPWTPT